MIAFVEGPMTNPMLFLMMAKTGRNAPFVRRLETHPAARSYPYVSSLGWRLPAANHTGQRPDPRQVLWVSRGIFPWPMAWHFQGALFRRSEFDRVM